MSQHKLQVALGKQLIRCGFVPDAAGKTWTRTRKDESGAELPEQVVPSALRNDQLRDLEKKYAAEAQPAVQDLAPAEPPADPAAGEGEGGGDANANNG